MAVMGRQRKLLMSAAVAVYLAASSVGGIFLGFQIDDIDHRSTDAGAYIGGIILGLRIILGLILGLIVIIVALAVASGVRNWWDWVHR